MILQELLFPKIGETAKDMYIRCDFDENSLNTTEKRLTMKNRQTVWFDTYFNSFSVEKWNKWTVVNTVKLHLTLKGAFEVALTRFEIDGDGLAKYVLSGDSVSCSETREFQFTYPPCLSQGVLAFEITALEKNSEFHGGAYYAEIDESSLPEVNLALCICTYRREDYIRNTIAMLQRDVFGNKDSPLHGRLRVYIADNGRTLKSEDTVNDEIWLFPNINAGGSGGFTRAMIEALEEREKTSLTHIVLMDDDVVFTADALERTYTFLRALKPDNRNIILGGAMLRIDRPYLQHGAGETWRVNGTVFGKINYDMRVLADVVRNEIEDGSNQLAWWFCCFPISSPQDDILSIPIFFQYDDIDFNQRHRDMAKVTLNGVCLWHESFNKKQSLWKEYYAIRNRLVICALHGSDAEFTPLFVQRLLGGVVLRNILLYRYKCAWLALRAVEDWFKGFEWLAAQDPDTLHREVMASVYKPAPLGELPVVFNYESYKQNKEWEKEGRIRRLFRRMTLNGLFLPANRQGVIIPARNPIHGCLYRAGSALNYDEESGRGFMVYRNIKEFLRVCMAYLRMVKKIRRLFTETVKSYRESYPQYKTESFWRGYLGV
ncbi:MAG: glycosyltransferase [Treponema sp.]|nr:glycosyltransferase [Treponema sp.]